MSDEQQDWGAVEAYPSVFATSIDPEMLDLAARIEAQGVEAWPAQEVERWSDGWIMRATPGLPGRGRSNHALVPVREIDRSEYDGALNRVAEFAAKHDVQCGIQVGPLDLHLGLLGELQVRSWEIQEAVCVMTGETDAVGELADPGFELTVTDEASDAWLQAWAACDPRRTDIPEHQRTVLRYLRGHARFFHHQDHAVGISVEGDGLLALFCIAVNPDDRRQGLGKKLISGMLAHATAAPTTYLQVFSGNEAGVALYESLGFVERYRYCHCIAP